MSGTLAVDSEAGLAWAGGGWTGPDVEPRLCTLCRRNEELAAENRALLQDPRAGSFDEIVGRSAALEHVLRQVEQVAATDAPVLLLGETGTGKDLIARAVHGRSPRGERPMVTVNCAALPAALVESELFGYEPGAFTGALRRTAGRFETAHGGTLFLDEVAELPLEVQPKLLRVLQTGEFERLGSARTTRVDVRVIAATNRQLEREVAHGRFRPDLYYRLSVFPLRVPPLRERVEDVPLLVWHFIQRRQAAIGRVIRRVPEPLMRAFCSHPWPGNVRELQNTVERALILTSGSSLSAAGFPGALPAAPRAASPGERDEQGERDEPDRPGADVTLEAVERAHILKVLAACGGKVAGRGNAAERLGLKRATLQYRMKKLGIARTPPLPRP